MLRKKDIALLAVASVGRVSPTTALARGGGGGGGFHGGGMSGGGFHDGGSGRGGFHGGMAGGLRDGGKFRDRGGFHDRDRDFGFYPYDDYARAHQAWLAPATPSGVRLID